MARASSCVAFALYTLCPSQGTTPLKFPSLHISLLPGMLLLLLSLAPLLSPSSARFLPPIFPSLRPCLRSFLTRSLPQPSLPPSTPVPTLPHTIASSLPRFPCSSSPHRPLAPSSHPRSVLPCLHACLPPADQFNVHRMCVWQAALYCVAPSHTETMGCSRQKKVSFQWVAVSFSERDPTTNPFLTKSTTSDDRHVQRIRHKHGRRSYISVGVSGDFQSLLERETTRSKHRGLLSYNCI